MGGREGDGGDGGHSFGRRRPRSSVIRTVARKGLNAVAARVLLPGCLQDDGNIGVVDEGRPVDEAVVENFADCPCGRPIEPPPEQLTERVE